MSIILLSGMGLCIWISSLFFDKFHILWPGGINLINDVTRDASAWFSYKHRDIYEIHRDIFLIRVETGLDLKRFALTPDSALRQVAGLYIAPRSINGYEKDPEGSKVRTYRGRRYEVDVVGIVRAGTMVQCDQLLRHTAYTLWYKKQIDYTVYGTILNGQFAGTLVDIDDISTFCNITLPDCDPRDAQGRIRRSPDERILRKIDRGRSLK